MLNRLLVLAPPIGSVGGIQTYTSRMFGALERILGHEHVRMVAVAAEPQQMQHGREALGFSVKAGFLARALAAAVSWQPDLVISMHLGTARAARIIQQVRGIPYWLVLHGVEVWGKLPQAKLRALLAASRYIALTNFTYRAMATAHSIANPPPLTLLRPCLEVPSVEPLGDRAAQATQAPVVLTVSRIKASERFKGHDVMLEAWPVVLASIPGAEYWIVGEGDDRARLESRAADLGIASSVRFTGELPAAALRTAYQRCTVFAMPASTDLNPAAPRGEGFGIVYAEAMSYGKPVVAPMEGAPAEYIVDGAYGVLVDPRCPQNVAQALIALLKDPPRALALGAAGREWVKQELDCERFCATLRSALETELAVRL